MPNSSAHERLVAQLAKIGASGGLDLESCVQASEKIAGAYMLLLRLGRRVSVRRRGTNYEFEPGLYLYVGNAYGPGGIGARLRRHLRRDKAIHWHIDHLTTSGDVVAVYAFPDGRECDIVQRLVGSQSISYGPAGFGSSDCRRCRSHLLQSRPLIKSKSAVISSSLL